jgi:N-terminal region of Chorein or VPS13
VPLEIIDGYIGSISVSVPWSTLIADNTVIEINDLEITVAPKQCSDNGGGHCLCFFWKNLHCCSSLMS